MESMSTGGEVSKIQTLKIGKLENEEKKDEEDLPTVKLNVNLSNIVGIDPLNIEFDEDESLNEMIEKIKKFTNIDDIKFQHQFTTKSYKITIGDLDIIDFKNRKFEISSNARFILLDETKQCEQETKLDEDISSLSSSTNLNNVNQMRKTKQKLDMMVIYL